MKKLTAVLASGTILSVCASVALAQDATFEQAPRFTWGADLEIESETVLKSDNPSAEITDTLATVEAFADYAITDNFGIFAALTIETLTDAVGHRAFEDMGAYLHEIGFRFSALNGEFFIGKVSPVFGAAWDEAAGYHGGHLAEDYELTEMIGALADVDIGDAGMLSFGIFYRDDTVLSESVGHKRDRNTTAAGGAGNTGELNNATIQWRKDWDSTFAYVGARYLTAGTGDVDDEKGVVAGVGHAFNDSLALYGEVASFQNWEGGADDATFVTLNAAYALGAATTLSGTYARRDIDSAGVTDLASIGLEYEFQNGITVGGAFAMVDEAGVEDQRVGLNVVFPFGG